MFLSIAHVICLVKGRGPMAREQAELPVEQAWLAVEQAWLAVEQAWLAEARVQA
jgi:hypothetical protein